MPALTIEVGNTTVAEAKKQLVLRTLATTGGDMVRTAKVLGLEVAEVIAELSGLLGGNGAAPHVAAANAAPAQSGGGAERAPARKSGAVPAHTPAAKSKAAPAKGKKR